MLVHEVLPARNHAEEARRGRCVRLRYRIEVGRLVLLRQLAKGLANRGGTGKLPLQSGS